VVSPSSSERILSHVSGVNYVFMRINVYKPKPISGVKAIYPLVAFYEIHGRKREVLFFYFVPDTTRDTRGHGITM
jgi:hypothetical protein